MKYSSLMATSCKHIAVSRSSSFPVLINFTNISIDTCASRDGINLHFKYLIGRFAHDERSWVRLELHQTLLTNCSSSTMCPYRLVNPTQSSNLEFKDRIERYSPMPKARKNLLSPFDLFNKLGDILWAPDGDQHPDDSLVCSTMKWSI